MVEIQCVAAHPRPEKKAKTAHKLGVLEKVLRWIRRGPSSQAGPKSAGQVVYCIHGCLAVHNMKFYERYERLAGKIVPFRLFGFGVKT